MILSDTMNGKLLTAIVTLVAVIGFAMPIACVDDSSAAGKITVTDGKGQTITLDSVPEHLFIVGNGAVATVIDVGALDKIVVCETYAVAASASNPVFDGLKERARNGEVYANGNYYSKASDMEKDLLSAIGNNKFDKSKDVAIVTGTTDTAFRNIDPVLENCGVKNVLRWGAITEYNEIVNFAKQISLVCTGEVNEKVNQMNYVVKYIEDTVSNSKKDPAKGFYVTYSASNYKVGSFGSLGNMLIDTACGYSVTETAEKSSTYVYDKGSVADLTTLIANYGKDTVIFVDNSIGGTESRLQAVREAVGSDVTIVKLDSLWNNYSPECTTGVWTVACALYPDLFQGDIPTADPEKSNNTVVYVIAGVIAVGAIALVAVFFLRK